MKQLWDQDLLYRDYKVNMHCPRCVTTLADQEVAQGYKENTEDPSIWPKFKVKERVTGPLAGLPEPAYFLAWTTTPWTLPANVALALRPDGVYVAAKHEDEVLILAEELLERNLGEGVEVLRQIHRQPNSPASPTRISIPACPTPATWSICPPPTRPLSPMTTSRSTTARGSCTSRPAYGDLEIGRRHHLPMLFSVDLQGMMLPELRQFEGRFFKEADPYIIRDLKERGLDVQDRACTKHTYPFCWRCDAPAAFLRKIELVYPHHGEERRCW